MMNCIDIICRAMRRLGIIAAGEYPQDNEAQDALETLKGIYRRLITDGAFGVIRDVCWEVGEYTACPGQRITVAPDACVTLPETAPDMAVICIVDRARDQIDEWIFDGREKVWSTIDDLDLTSAAPLSNRDVIGLACYLAVELADEYGQQPTQITLKNAARFQIGISHNWSVEPATQHGIFF